MNTFDKEDGQSKRLADDNIKALKAMMPEAFSDGGIDFDRLRQSLGEHVLDAEEKYGLTWHGKAKSTQIALKPTTGTLRPCLQESIHWDTTQNLFIEGDNLEVLKLLQQSYAGKIKMIYIDPPYNTEGDFIYSDCFQDNLDKYLRYTGQVDENGLKSSSNTEASGRKHTNWLNMMLPRIRLARTLLADNGVIVCHIDEHEVSNLYALLDEVFGSENNLGPVVWDKRNPKGDATGIAAQHEYIAVYAKNLERLKEDKPIRRPKANAERMMKKARSLFAKLGKRSIPKDLGTIVKKYKLPIDVSQYEKEWSLDAINAEYQQWLCRQSLSGGEAAYKFIDEEGQIYRSVSMAWPNKTPAPAEYFIPLKHPVTGRDCPVPERGWRSPPATMKKLLEENRILFGADETKQPERKYVLSENMEENIPSILPFGGSDDTLLAKLGIPFDNPKPVAFAQNLLKYFLADGDMVLDFFAGSATTAHASMGLCAEDGRKFRFLLVQLPEILDPLKKQQKNAAEFCKSIGKPMNIAEISKERIRRTIGKLQEEYPDSDSDLGFRIFRLDSSNIHAWQPDASNLEQSLIDHVEHLVAGRSNQDVLYEILLKRGIDLTVSVKEKEFVRKTVYSVDNGLLFVCLDERISADDVEELGQGIADWYNELQPEMGTQVIFRDSAFETDRNDKFDDDVVKTNMVVILEQNGIVNVRSI